MHRRRLLPTAIGTLALALVATTGLAGPAGATSTAKTVVSATFLDAHHAPLHDIRLLATRGSTTVDLGVTDSEGDIVAQAGKGRATLTPGTWTFLTLDVEKHRVHDRMAFASAVISKTISAGSNDLGDHDLDQGASLGGSVRAPSGTPLDHVYVSAYVQRYDGRRFVQSVDRTGGTNGFTLTPVGISGMPEYEVHVTASRAKRLTGARFETTGVVSTVRPGDTDHGLTINDWQVQCDASLRLSSHRRGQVGLSVASNAAWAGVPKPGGTIVIKRGRTVVKTVDWTNRSTYRTTLHRQPRGQRAVYTASYEGGDCVSWSKAAAVRVRR